MSLETVKQLHPTLIIVALNGARKTKKDHPFLPITPEEIAEEVDKCVTEGAAMVHLHARSKSGEHSLNIEDNFNVYHAVQEKIGDKAVIQLTTEAIGKYSPQEQMQLIDAIHPEAASFALMELIPDVSHETNASEFFYTIAKQGMLAQIILYSPQQLAYYLSLVERKILPDFNQHVLIVLGRYQPNQLSQPSDLDEYLPILPKLGAIRWAVCAFGKNELDCLSYAAKLGGDTRVGFENNLYNKQGLLAKDNREQVAALKNELLLRGHKLTTATEVRNWIKYLPKN